LAPNKAVERKMLFLFSPRNIQRLIDLSLPPNAAVERKMLFLFSPRTLEGFSWFQLVSTSDREYSGF